MSGKGSKPCPMQIQRTQFDNNWEVIFNCKDQNEWIANVIMKAEYYDLDDDAHDTNDHTK